MARTKHTGSGQRTGDNIILSNGTRRVDLQDKRPWTVFGVDCGTSTWSVAYGTKMPGKPMEMIDLRAFRLPSECSKIGHMVAAWHRGQFHFGRSVIKQSADPVPIEHRITGFKMKLYDIHETSGQVRRVNTQLDAAGHSYEELLEGVFRKIWDEICQVARSSFLDMHIDRTAVYLAVPLLATDKATDIMARAAKKAGLPRVRFVYEPLCAGASILRAILKNQVTEEAYSRLGGCAVQSTDMGGGTTDIVTLRLPPRMEDLEHNRVEQLNVDGICCGSTDVDESFVRWLREEIKGREGGMAGVCQKLDLSQEEIVAKATTEFQSIKKNEEEAPLFIHDSRERDRQREEFNLPIELIHSFFDRHIDAIIEAQEKNLTPDTTYIVLSGGLAENEYVYERIKQHFAQKGVQVERSPVHYDDSPVATGALMIDDDLDLSGITSKYAVGILFEDEDVNRKHHPDAYDNRNRFVDGIVFQDAMYTKSRRKTSNIVHDRITWLIEKGTRADVTGHFAVTLPKLQQFHVPVDNPIITHTVILTTKDSTRDHEPLRDKAGNELPGFIVFKQWMELPPAFVNRSIRNGWQLTDPDGVKMLELWCEVKLRYNNMRIEITRRFVKPESVAYSNRENWTKGAASKFRFDDSNYEEIYDANYDTKIIDTRLKRNDLDSPGRENRADSAAASSSTHRRNHAHRRHSSQDDSDSVELGDVASSAAALLGATHHAYRTRRGHWSTPTFNAINGGSERNKRRRPENDDVERSSDKRRRSSRLSSVRVG